MKNSYIPLVAVVSFLFSVSCHKADLPGHGHEGKIEGGPWYIMPTSSSGTGPIKKLDFDNGYVNFLPNGRLEYTNKWMKLYQGSWELEVYSYYDEYDQQQCYYYLRMIAINDQAQDNFSGYYGVEFEGTDRFEATVYTPARIYNFEFRR